MAQLDAHARRNRSPQILATRSRRCGAALRRCQASTPSCRCATSANADIEARQRQCARACAAMCWYSVASVRRNLRRAGTLKNKSRTSTLVPEPMRGRRGCTDLAVARIHHPGMRGLRSARCQATTGKPRRYSAALRRESPRSRRFRGPRGEAILLVACRASARPMSDASMPTPSSRNPDQSAAAALQFNLDAPRARIQGIFDQLLDHGGRTLDHLAGGDLIDERIGE